MSTTGQQGEKSNEEKIQDFFIQSVNKKFNEWCKKHSLKTNTENLVRFLISHTYIERKNVMRSFIVDFVNDDLTMSKTQRIDQLDIEFDIPPSSSWTCLKHYQRRFQEKKRVKLEF